METQSMDQTHIRDGLSATVHIASAADWPGRLRRAGLNWLVALYTPYLPEEP